MKKIIGSTLAGVMLLSMSTVCFAAESDVDTLSTEPTDERIYVISDESLTTNKGAREPSWGKGTLYTSNPLFSKPSGYAETTTYAGTAYSMYALLQLIDADGISYLSDKPYAYNTTSVRTSTLLSPTSRCSFHGSHGIQATSTSGWQTTHTQKFID